MYAQVDLIIQEASKFHSDCKRDDLFLHYVRRVARYYNGYEQTEKLAKEYGCIVDELKGIIYGK